MYVVVDNIMATPEGMITVAEAARRLGRSIEQVRRYLWEGRLQGQRIGNQWFIPEEALSLRYQPKGAPLRQVKEPTAVMETETRKLTKEEIEALIKRIDANRKAIRRRLGGDIDIDVVELLRQDREEH